MRVETFVRRSRIAAPAQLVFDWHEAPGAFQRLTPPWEPVRLLEQRGGIRDGAVVVIRVGPPPFAIRWVARHSGYIPGRQFRDVQESGPFALWEHTHIVEPDGENACWLEDSIRYALPFGFLGRLFGGAITRHKLDRMFAFRHEVTRRETEALSASAGGSASGPPVRP